MPVKVHVREGSSLSETADGFSHTRVIDVDGLASTEGRIMFDALGQGDVPKRGDAHPFVPGIFCRERRVEPLAATSVRITCVYGADLNQEFSRPGAVRSTQFFATTITEEVFFDIHGNRLVTAFTGRIGQSIRLTSLSPSIPGAENVLEEGTEIVFRQRWHSVIVDRPSVGVRLIRKETVSPRENVFRLIGKVNSRPWSGFSPKVWLCTNVDSQQLDNGHHDVAYTFLHRFDTRDNVGWRVRLHTTFDGEIPFTATIGNGQAVFDVLEEEDFNAVGLSF